MRYVARHLLLTVIGLGALTLPARASFEEQPTGGRATGMGQAMTAAADDAFALYYNPAGILHVKYNELSSYYGRLFTGLSDGSDISRSFVGYVRRMQKQAIGVSYTSLNLSGLYKEDTIGLSYARQFADDLNTGITLKRLHKSFGSDTYTDNAVDPLTGQDKGGPDPLFKDGSGVSAIGLDLGIQYRFSNKYSVGAVVINANEPNTALGSDKDPAPRIIKIGGARKTDHSLLALDVSRRRFTTDELRLNVGGEYWFPGGIGARTGFGWENGPPNAAAGFSYRWMALQLDYGFLIPLQGIKGTTGTHQFSLTLRWGKEPMWAELKSVHRPVPYTFSEPIDLELPKLIEEAGRPLK